MTAMMSAMIAMVRVFIPHVPFVCERHWRRPTSASLSRYAGLTADLRSRIRIHPKPKRRLYSTSAHTSTAKASSPKRTA
jgi:hypothetical protein